MNNSFEIQPTTLIDGTQCLEIPPRELFEAVKFLNAAPEFDFDIAAEYDAESVILANSNICDFAVAANGKVILTDPKRGVIWQIE